MFVPDGVVTNERLSRIMDTTDEWIRQRTGIEERHFARRGQGYITWLDVDVQATAGGSVNVGSGYDPSQFAQQPPGSTPF